MQELIDRLSEELLAAGFTLHPDIRLFYRVTDAGTFFYVDLYIKEGAIDILYGVVPTQNELGPCAAIHDFSGCLKFSRLIAWGSDIEERLAEAGAQIQKVYAEYSSSTPEQLKVHVAERRKRLYSIATEVLAPYKFEYRPSPNMQLWARSISPDISIEYRMESSPGLKHNGLICVHDRRDPDRAQLYLRNAHVNGETRIFWEDMDEETVLALTENALRATIIPLIELDIEKLLDERFFTEERGWYRMRHAIADMQLFGHITGRLTDMGMTRSAKYKNKYFMRLSPSQAIIVNIYDDNGKLEIMYGLKNDAIIFEDGIDWLAQVGGVIDPPDTCMQAVVSNRAEADIILEDIRRFISENTRRRGSFMRRIFNRIKSITGRHTPCNEGVQVLAWHLAGGCIRFSTDSEGLAVIWKLTDAGNMPHFTACGQSGLMLFEETNGVSRQIKNFIPQMDEGRGCRLEQSAYVALPGGMRNYALYLPLYNGLEELLIGVSPASVLAEGHVPRIEKPILFYGSSITQGGCASKAGSCYTSIVARRLDAAQVNLGFSGSGRGEENMARYIAGKEMSAFIMDYDHNAPDAAHLEATHERFFRIIRKAQPELPILILTMPDFDRDPEKNAIRRGIIRRTYENAIAVGDEHVYFIDGETFFGETDRDLCTVDDCHPNDLGFLRMADVVEPVLRGILLG